MLKDSSNKERPAVLKTFQRRPKQQAVQVTATGAAEHQGEKEHEASHRTRTNSNADEDAFNHEASLGMSSLVDGCPGGYLRCLKGRRASVMLPFSAHVVAANPRHKRASNRKDRERYLTIVAELKTYYAELDAFVLTEEDPGPKTPLPERRRHDSNQIRSHRNTAYGGAHVPTSHDAQGPNPTCRNDAPAAVALAQEAAFLKHAPAAASPAGAAAAAAARTTSGGWVDAGVGACRGSVVSSGGQFLQACLRASLDACPGPISVDSLARSVGRLYIDQHGGVTSSAAPAARSAAAPAGSTLSIGGRNAQSSSGNEPAESLQRASEHQRDSLSSEPRSCPAPSGRGEPEYVMDWETDKAPTASGSQCTSTGAIHESGSRRVSVLHPSGRGKPAVKPSNRTDPACSRSLSPAAAPREVPNGEASAVDRPPAAAAPPSVGLSGRLGPQTRLSSPPSMPRASVKDAAAGVSRAGAAPGQWRHADLQPVGAEGDGDEFREQDQGQQQGAEEPLRDRRRTASVAAGNSRTPMAAQTPAATAGPSAAQRSVAGAAAAASTAEDTEGSGPAAAAAEAPADAAPEDASGLDSALTPLQRLLVCCGQEPFLEHQKLPTMDKIIDQLITAAVVAQDGAAAAKRRGGGAAGRGPGRKAGMSKRPALVKVGEGSYGEAWRLGEGGHGNGIVIKVVPIEGNMTFNDGPQKTASDMLSETVMSRQLSGLAEGQPSAAGGASSSGAAGGSGHGSGAAPPANWTAGFVHMHAVAVCRGPYTKDLVKAWERWDKERGSENEPVSKLPPDQLYWIIAMDDSGVDLEKYVVDTWDQLRSVLLQTALSLAVAEAALLFEHRDLHWGNVLVRPAEQRPDLAPGGWLGARLRGRDLRVALCGVSTTIIDFTASCMMAPDGAHVYCDLNQDPAIFEGTVGEVQFDTYRWMRRMVGGDWSSSCPVTNCLWLSYLAEVLAKRFGGGGSGKGLRLSAAHKRQLREFRKRAVEYGSCGDLVWDDLFLGMLQADS